MYELHLFLPGRRTTHRKAFVSFCMICMEALIFFAQKKITFEPSIEEFVLPEKGNQTEKKMMENDFQNACSQNGQKRALGKLPSDVRTAL